MKRIYLLLPILAGIMFGSTGIFVRTLTENGVDSTTLLFLRFSIAILYIFIAIFLTDKSLLKINKEDIPLFVLCGLCILGLNLCYNSSINTVPLSLAAILLSTAPVFVLVLEYLLFKEKITSIKVLCVILVLIGCTLVTGLLEENSIDISWIGIIAGIGSAIFWAIYSVTSRKSIDMGRHTFTILLYSLITITIVTIPFTNFTQIANFVNLSPVQNILFLLLIALCIHNNFIESFRRGNSGHIILWRANCCSCIWYDILFGNAYSINGLWSGHYNSGIDTLKQKLCK